MATELRLILIFADEAPSADDIEYALDCDVIEYHEEDC